ncbi:type-1 restriction enzyme mjaxp r protein [Actinidia rufa]|uniref:Type-1 restriction enzyme mjaxp r protein n=1 Tax=Actinidia rufa TaxID=165716 RepID=A0A7J0GKC7_9ERIC|nr:type-1 restriction enzyme mjaxp r protein [Actinidia rufa]
MVKLVHIWKSLSDKNIVRLREEIKNSIGIRKLVSDDDDYIVRLICSEMIDSLGNVARAVGRIAKKCNNPALKSFEHVFDNLIKCGVYPDGWLFTWKKMERKVKKMERFISMNGNLYQEIESLSDLEHTLMRMKGSDDSAATTLVEYQKKVAWKRQEMKQLKGISLWNRTYDYAVRLLARSVFTIYSRIGHVFGIRSRDRDRDHSSTLQGKKLHPKTNSSTPIGPFKGSMVSGNSSPVKNCLDSGGDRFCNSWWYQRSINHQFQAQIVESISWNTWFCCVSALHYANVIIVIERLVASPHLIGHDARDDLYNMLPASVRSALRARLKPYTKSLTSSIYDTVLATEWTDAMSGILEWLSPLAHNMIRWQSERSFEHQNLVSKTNVLLVQTLYFADQEKTEATITELLVGLNYVWRFGKEINAKAILKCASGRTLDNCLDLDGSCLDWTKVPTGGLFLRHFSISNKGSNRWRLLEVLFSNFGKC